MLTSRIGRGVGSIFNQQGGPSSIWDEADPTLHGEAIVALPGRSSEASSKAAKLAELFRPPFDLMTRIPWDDARQRGKTNPNGFWSMCRIIRYLIASH